jgi:hypothetical protein
MSTDDATTLAAALDEARRNPSPVLVMPNSLLAIPGARDAFSRLAKVTGRMFGLQPHDPAMNAALASAAARTASIGERRTIDRHDKAAVLANLADIASGKVKCE